jgi:hypothetical protein
MTAIATMQRCGNAYIAALAALATERHNYEAPLTMDEVLKAMQATKYGQSEPILPD